MIIVQTNGGLMPNTMIHNLDNTKLDFAGQIPIQTKFFRTRSIILWLCHCRLRTDACYRYVLQIFQISDTESQMVQLIVITMYSKNGGKAGAHSWVADTGNIEALSYIVVQLYKHSHCLVQGLDQIWVGIIGINTMWCWSAVVLLVLSV
jgi:hypothetical protein